METKAFWPKNQSWEVPFQVCSSGGPLATPKWPQNDPKMRKTLISAGFFLTKNRVMVALRYINSWELMVFGQKSKVERFPPRFIALEAFWRPLIHPKMTQKEKKHWFYLVFFANHRVMVAFLCITIWKLMVFGQKSKIQRFPPRFIALGGPIRVFAGKGWPGGQHSVIFSNFSILAAWDF